jgi:TetR/AcrR family transcriptional regulator, transcriptional repressor for nem operon
MPYTAVHKQETRARIVWSAARLFNRKGFAEVTIAEIMRAADLTHGGFYRHFSGKEELYAEAVRQFLCKSAPEPWQKNHVDPCARGSELARMIVDAYFSPTTRRTVKARVPSSACLRTSRVAVKR